MLALAFVVGLSSGLRTFTAPAVLLLGMRYRTPGIIVAILAVGELIADALPSMGSRTKPGPVIGRLISGAFVGWLVAAGAVAAPATATHIAGAILGAIGALVGTYGGHALRLKAIASIGAIPAALVEDAVAIGLPVATVFALGN